MNRAPGNPGDDDGASPRSPVDRLLDLGVFAPLGFLLDRRDLIPQLARAGRRQIAFSRSLGQAVLKGLIRGAKKTTAGSSHPEPTTPVSAEPVPEARVETASDVVDSGEEPVETGAVDTDVPGYDDMTAREVIALLTSCETAQVAWIVERETATKNRVTVLRAAERRTG